jgi:hypothetical protein
METFLELRSGAAYDYVGMLKDVLHGERSLYDASYFFDPLNSELMQKALKPAQKTLLHDLIAELLYADITYSISKAWDVVAEQMFLLLRNLGIPFLSPEDVPESVDYSGYVENILIEQAIPVITDEVFNIAFQDRGLMKAFNSVVAESVREMSAEDHPAFLKRDGVFERCEYWPSWLRDGLNRRDKGHCAICQTDVSGILARGVVVHIDHIIPLNLGGTNDPTNLQLLCNPCNGDKGGDETTTSAFVPRFW